MQTSCAQLPWTTGCLIIQLPWHSSSGCCYSVKDKWYWLKFQQRFVQIYVVLDQIWPHFKSMRYYLLLYGYFFRGDKIDLPRSNKNWNSVETLPSERKREIIVFTISVEYYITCYLHARAVSDIIYMQI